MPSLARLTTLPLLISSLTIRLTVLVGIAYPTASYSVPASFEEVMPTTCEYIFTSAPPELPGFIALSVWISLAE